jgi:hypothetical protein
MTIDLLILLLALFIVWHLYHLRRQTWLRQLLYGKPPPRASKPQELKPKSEKDCPHCQSEKARLGPAAAIGSDGPRPWREMKGKGGGVRPQTRKHRARAFAKGLPTAGTLVATALLTVEGNVARPALAPCFTFGIRAELLMSVHRLGLCHGKPSLPDERFYFKPSPYHQLVG